MAAQGEDFVILACTVLTFDRAAKCEGRTDRQIAGCQDDS